MATITAHSLAFAFGILGNIVSFIVYLAPVPTFYRIFRRKSTEGFHSIPYSVALFSAMLLLYYAFLKTNGFMLITINSIGCAIESFYLIIYLIYAPKPSKIYTGKLLILFNIGLYGVILILTTVFFEGSRRLTIVGWICAVFSVCVFAAPLSVMRLVIRTKSVEFMPFWLSFFLTLCAIMWFFYGLFIKDYFVATPNILGFGFGIAQMILYVIYKEKKKKILPEYKVQELEKGIQMSKPEEPEYKVQELEKGIQMSKPEDEVVINGGISESVKKNVVTSDFIIV